MTEILVGHVASPSLRYVQETDSSPDGFEAVDVQVTVREWDVTDPEARTKATVDALGPIDEHNRCNAQWFIDPDRNAAGLAVFRPSYFSLKEEPA